MEKPKLTSRRRFAAAVRNHEIESEERFRERIKLKEDVNSDSNIRKEIHAVIIKEITSGKNKEEIIKDLSIERYSKYNMYFENWINDKFKKLRPETQIEER